MSYLQIPHQQLIALGQDMKRLQQGLEADHHGASDVSGLDGSDHDRIVTAIEGYRDEWKSSLLELLDSLGSTGELSAAIGKLTSETDQKLAEAMKGKR